MTRPYELAGLTSVGRRFIGDLENSKETAQLGKALHIAERLGRFPVGDAKMAAIVNAWVDGRYAD